MMKMKLRAPATPLITIDPYFSIWSVSDELNSGETVHWTCKPNRITGILTIDNQEYLFMGNKENTVKMVQTECDIKAMSTIYKFSTGSVELTLTFTSPLLLDDLKILSRPVSYLKADLRGLDNASHQARISITVEDDVCLDTRHECPTEGESITIDSGIACARMGSILQPVLGKAGDDVRINWGYFYLAVKAGLPEVHIRKQGEATCLEACATLDTLDQNSALFTFAYDDINCLQYFGENLKGYWVKESDDIKEIIRRSYHDYDVIVKSCSRFGDDLYQAALASGGEKYAELLTLAYRQTIAAHKLCEDKKGEILFISKECFSNACAATVDVTYPSIPLFLLYNQELVKGMLRPVFKYAATDVWYHDFAPHDVGMYPLVNGQVYGGGTDPKDQMPIEECGNMLVTMAAVCLASGDFNFAADYLPTLKQWSEYLIKYGSDPENQLCTDDFAGHLAHNCNLSVKAIMGIASFGIIMEKLTGKEEATTYYDTAREMAKSWVERAMNEDGTFRLTFDQADTFSMKYNVIWDQLFKTGIFAEELLEKELKGYLEHINLYGMPLDNRATYTKSDWLVWSATLMKNKEDFEQMVEPLWKAYHETESRVPMTDWYDTLTAKQIGFQHRSVQGGLYIKLLMDRVSK
jgi:hypothetical protein